MMATLPQLMAHLLPFFMCFFFHFNYPFFWWVGIEAFTASILQPWILNLSIFFSAFHWHGFGHLSVCLARSSLQSSCSIRVWVYYVCRSRANDQDMGICLQISFDLHRSFNQSRVWVYVCRSVLTFIDHLTRAGFGYMFADQF